jgi:hypothetical protein
VERLAVDLADCGTDRVLGLTDDLLKPGTDAVEWDEPAAEKGGKGRKRIGQAADSDESWASRMTFSNLARMLLSGMDESAAEKGGKVERGKRGKGRHRSGRGSRDGVRQRRVVWEQRGRQGGMEGEGPPRRG